VSYDWEKADEMENKKPSRSGISFLMFNGFNGLRKCLQTVPHKELEIRRRARFPTEISFCTGYTNARIKMI
jgi:hypothetical protein